MRKIISIFLIIIFLFMFISCNNEDDKENNENDPPIEDKIITDFTVPDIINLYLYETKKIDINYDRDCAVVFNINPSSEKIVIEGNDITALDTGSFVITIEEERSKIKKEIDVNVTLKKNDQIDFYNGFYVFDECVYVPGGNKYQMNLLYKDRLCINLFDDINLIEVTPFEGYEKAYLIESTDIVILIKNNELYGSIIINSDDSFSGIIKYQVIYSLKLEILLNYNEGTFNETLGLYNGIYRCCFTLYATYGGGIKAANEMLYGNFAMIVSDDISYVETTLDDFARINSVFLDIKNNDLSFGYNHIITKEDVYKCFNAFSKDNILLYSVMFTSNGDVYYMDVNASQDSVNISYIVKVRLVGCLVDEETIEYTTLSNDLINDYCFDELIYSAEAFSQVNLNGKYALSITKDTLFNVNDDLTNIPGDLRIIKRYDFKDDSDIYTKSLLFDDQDIYYALSNKDNSSFLMIWKITKSSVNITSNFSGIYYISEIIFNYSDINNSESKNDLFDIIDISEEDLINDINEYELSKILYELNTPVYRNYNYHYYLDDVILFNVNENLSSFAIKDNHGISYLLVLYKNISSGYSIRYLARMEKIS